MFGSQALETAIGLILMFFVVALAASTVAEVFSRLVSKRSVDLERTLAAMLAGSSASDTALADALATIKGTSVYDAATAAAGRTLFRKKWKRPSYLSAKSFADAISEIANSLPRTSDGELDLSALPVGVRTRVSALIEEVGDDVTRIKAGLEHWFDETMSRLEGAYKRWVIGVLFVVGAVIAISGNASTFHVAERLWNEPVTRQVVVDAADRVVAEGAGAQELASIAAATDELTELGLPVGWDDEAKEAFDAGTWWKVWEWRWTQLGYVGGWLLTGLLVTLGAPFWFDLLTKAVSLRQSGSKPPRATGDPTSATTRLISATTEA